MIALGCLAKPDKRCVAGVITVQAPNHGSPLANGDPANVNSISDGLFSILTGCAGYPISPTRCARCTASALLRALSFRYRALVCSFTVCGDK